MSTYNSKFSGAKIDELLEKVASGQVSSAGGSSWTLAGTSSTLSGGGITGITGLTDENTEYLCRIRANVGSVWDYTITLVRGSGASNIRNGTQLWLHMNSIDWMTVDAVIEDDGEAMVRLYSGTTDITSTLASNITEIAIYKRSITS